MHSRKLFDELRRMEPGDSHGEQIVVDFEVETDEDGIEINRHLYVSNCEGDFWEACLAKDVVIKADVSETTSTFLSYVPSSPAPRFEEGGHKNDLLSSLEARFEEGGGRVNSRVSSVRYSVCPG